MTSSQNKLCSKCLNEIPYSEFHKDKTHKDGHRSHCKSCEKKINLNWRISNRAKLLAKKSMYRLENKENERKYKSIYRASNKESIRNYDKSYRLKNHESDLLRKSEYHKANPEKQKERSNRRRVRKIGAIGFHTISDIKQLAILQKNKCAICKTSITNKYHVDHIVALSIGGSNDKYNIQLLCPTCNLKKHNKHNIKFMQSIGMLL